MKKLFLPLALLTLCGARASEVAAPDSAEISTQVQNAINGRAQQVANALATIPEVGEALEDFSQDELSSFYNLCVQLAQLEYSILVQYHPLYTQVFNGLTELTGYDLWASQMVFLSPQQAAALQAQQNAQNNAFVDENDFDDEDDQA